MIFEPRDGAEAGVACSAGDCCEFQVIPVELGAGVAGVFQVIAISFQGIALSIVFIALGIGNGAIGIERNDRAV